MDDLLLRKIVWKQFVYHFTLIAIALLIMIPAAIRIYVLRKKLIKEEKEIHKLNLITEEANETKSHFSKYEL